MRPSCMRRPELEDRAPAPLLAPPLGRAAAVSARRCDGGQILAGEDGPRQRVKRFLDVKITAGRGLQ